MKAASFSSSISATWATPEKQWLKFTSIRSSNEEWPTLSYFCELVEGEENKLTYIFHMDYSVRV